MRWDQECIHSGEQYGVSGPVNYLCLKQVAQQQASCISQKWNESQMKVNQPKVSRNMFPYPERAYIENWGCVELISGVSVAFLFPL